MGFPQQGGYYMPAIPQPQRFFSQAQAGMRHSLGQPRWPQQGRGAGANMMNMQSQFRGQRPGAPRMSQAMVRPMAGQQVMPMMTARPGMPPQAMAQMQPQAMAAITAIQGQRGAANYKYGPNVRNPAQVNLSTPLKIYFRLKLHFSWSRILETNFASYEL